MTDENTSEIIDLDEDIEGQLHPRHVRFCQEYMVDMNGTQAYIRAGYGERSAGVQSCLLLKNPNIKAYIAQLQKDRAKRLEITADKVLAEIARLAFSNVQNIFEGQDGLRRVTELDADTAAAVQSVKVTKKPSGGQDENGNMVYEDVVEYKLADKNRSLDMLGKHLELFIERSKIEVTEGDGMMEKMRKARERLEQGVETELPTQGPEIDAMNYDEGDLDDEYLYD